MFLMIVSHLHPLSRLLGFCYPWRSSSHRDHPPTDMRPVRFSDFATCSVSSTRVKKVDFTG